MGDYVLLRPESVGNRAGVLQVVEMGIAHAGVESVRVRPMEASDSETGVTALGTLVDWIDMVYTKEELCGPTGGMFACLFHCRADGVGFESGETRNAKISSA